VGNRQTMHVLSHLHAHHAGMWVPFLIGISNAKPRLRTDIHVQPIYTTNRTCSERYLPRSRSHGGVNGNKESGGWDEGGRTGHEHAVVLR
jgi:hypothetical protein